MTGIYGSSFEDCYWESRLLDHVDPVCPECEQDADRCICEEFQPEYETDIHAEFFEDKE